MKFYILLSALIPFHLYASVSDLIELKKIGLDDSTIITAAQQDKSKLQPIDLIKLKKNGFSNELINKLMTKAVEAQPSRIIIQQAGIPVGQIEIIVHSHAAGGKFHVDGSMMGSIHNGVNKFTVPSGKHTLRLDYSNKVFKKEVILDPKKTNVFHIFYIDEPNDNSKLLSQKYFERNIREIAMFKKKSFPVNILNSNSEIIGRTYYTNIKNTLLKTIKTFDKELTRVAFTGYLTTYFQGSEDKKISKSPTVFFYLDLEGNGEVANTYINHKGAQQAFLNAQQAYKSLDRTISIVKKYDFKNHQPNIKVVYSDKAKRDTQGFTLSINLSGQLYDLTQNNGENAVCPLACSYKYLWRRKGVAPSKSFYVQPDKKLIIAIHSNWIGNQTRIYHVPMDTDFSKVTFKNASEF